MGAVRWARGVATAILSAPLLVLTQLLTGASRPAAGLLLLALVAVAAVTVLLDAPLRAGSGSLRLALVTGLAQLAGYTVLAVTDRGTGTGCLPTVGRGAGVLLRLDGPVQGCTSTGMLTAGGGAVTAVMLAAGILLCHALLAGLSASLLTAAGVALATATDLVRSTLRLLPRLPGRPTLPIRARLPRRHPAPLLPAPGRAATRQPARRGPPSPRLALLPG